MAEALMSSRTVWICLVKISMECHGQRQLLGYFAEQCWVDGGCLGLPKFIPLRPKWRGIWYYDL